MCENFFQKFQSFDIPFLIVLNKYYSDVTFLLNSLYPFLNLNQIDTLQCIHYNLTKINDLIIFAKKKNDEKHLQNTLLNNFILNTIKKFHFKMLKDMILNIGNENAYKLFEEVKLAFQSNETANQKNDSINIQNIDSNNDKRSEIKKKRKNSNKKKPKLKKKRKDTERYPSIICMVCNKWLCARNRISHMEAHLNYRPYRCSYCTFSCKKNIFFMVHKKKKHPGLGHVILEKNLATEKKIEILANQSIEFTKNYKKFKSIKKAYKVTIESTNPYEQEDFNRSTTPDKCIKELLNDL